MRNRINTIPPDTVLGYAERMAILRERKVEDTLDKKGFGPFADSDDYGAVMPPEDYEFRRYENNVDGCWYGCDGWSKNFYNLMCTHPVFIDPCDAFPNRFMFCLTWMRNPPRFHPSVDYDHLRPLQELYGIVSGIGSDAHFGGDYAIGLSLGWGGLLKKIEEFRVQNPGSDEFYDAEALVVKGIQQWMRNTVTGIDEALELEQHPALRENLVEMRACTEHLIDGAPRTLREACEWMCWFNMASREYNRDGAGCQLDETLLPYFERDAANGVLTREDARFYIACLLLNDAHYYQVGGLSADGRDMVTDMSYLVLEAADLLNSSCNITVRVHEGMDMDFLRASVAYLFKNKNGWPRFSGDRALRSGFVRKGYPDELASLRVAVGCHWMSLPGLEYTLNDCVKTNNARVFSVALDEMMADGGERSVERLWTLFDKHTRRAVEITAEGVRFHLKYQAENEPELMLNLISHGPVERGLDMSHGGAQYYNMCIDGTGLATVADSFAALEQRVEQERRLSWDEMYQAIKNNFAGDRGAYIKAMLSSCNRYCGGDTPADAWAVRISNAFSRHVNAQDDDRVKFIPGWFSWSNTIKLGSVVGATPNGRGAGEPINHSCNPHPGFRKDGALTAMSNSICAIQPGYGNTAPIQLELDPGIANDEEGIQKLTDYIRTIFQKGATLLNINIIDAERILKAHENPELFPDLVVRVTGFTAYFCLLTQEFRQLVVDRILRAQ